MIVCVLFRNRNPYIVIVFTSLIMSQSTIVLPLLSSIMPMNSNVSSPIQEVSVDSFSDMISSFVSFAESNGKSNYTISNLCERFGFQRRRLYDVINVLETIGLCEKTSVDTISWVGMAYIPIKMQKLAENHHMTMFENSLNQPNSPISIGELTKSFLMCYLYLKKRSIDIKNVGRMLSHANGRYKTTLCKLYQITHILEAAGIIEKSVIPGEMILTTSIFTNSKKRTDLPIPLLKEQTRIDKINNPLSINFLLNRPVNA